MCRFNLSLMGSEPFTAICWCDGMWLRRVSSLAHVSGAPQHSKRRRPSSVLLEGKQLPWRSSRAANASNAVGADQRGELRNCRTQKLGAEAQWVTLAVKSIGRAENGCEASNVELDPKWSEELEPKWLRKCSLMW